LSVAVSNHSKVSTLTSTAITALLSDEQKLEEILATGRAELALLAGEAMQFLQFHGLCFIRPVAGVFIWARMAHGSCTWEEEAELNRQFLLAGVSLGAGSGYCAVQPGWFRITFALPRAVLHEAFRRIEVALRAGQRWQPPGKPGLRGSQEVV
jgi:DNA-binding transcriptional MocR family regulator